MPGPHSTAVEENVRQVIAGLVEGMDFLDQRRRRRTALLPKVQTTDAACASGAEHLRTGEWAYNSDV
jgi:hypothetical protein